MNEYMELLKILVLDDDADALDSTVRAVGSYVSKDRIFAANRVSDALDLIEKNEINTAFIDINLGEDSGFQVAARLHNLFPHVSLVFCTGHQEYALEGYDYDPLGFLMKPVSLIRLEKILHKAARIASSSGEHAVSAEDRPQAVAVSTSGGFNMINPDDIYYIEKKSRKAIIYCHGGEVTVSRYSLNQLEEIFSDVSFFQPHRAYLVPLQEIQNVIIDETKEAYSMTLKRSDTKIPMARGKPNELKKILACHGIKFI
jgi:DNA-binding LytR/AlgR family response regulator